jgi:hypothetical protein
MTLRVQIRQWCTRAGLLLALVASPSFAQNHRDQQRSVPRPNVHEQRRQPHNETRRESRPQPNREPARPPQFQSTPRAPRDYRSYQPPAQGHHSGQWLNRERQLPPEQRARTLESDPAFRRLPRETQRQYEQRLQRFNSMPTDRQQQVLHRMETWEHLTPQQKQDLRGIGSQFNNLPVDRRRAVRNAIDTLRAMPPDARQRELQSGRFNQFSPQERDILNGASRLPLAPTPGDAGNSEQQNPPPDAGRDRYVPRPPR